MDKYVHVECFYIADLCHLLGMTTKSKKYSFQIQWVYRFCVFFFNPSEWLWRYRIIIYYEYVDIVDLCHLLGMTIQEIQKYRNQIEIKKFIFSVFFFNPSKLLWRYRENIYCKCVNIADLCHLLGMTIQNTETKLKSKSFQIQWVYSFFVFFFNPSKFL